MRETGFIFIGRQLHFEYVLIYTLHKLHNALYAQMKLSYLRPVHLRDIRVTSRKIAFNM